MKVEFVISVEGVPKGRPRLTRSGHAYTPAKTKKFETLVAKCARFAMSRHGAYPIEGAPVAVSLLFYYEPPTSWSKRRKLEVIEKGAVPKFTKPDTDNLEKAVLDGMNGIVYKDDALISTLVSSKLYSYVNGNSVHVCVSTIEEDA